MGKRSFFSVDFYKKNYSLTPIVFITGLVVVGVSAFALRSALVNDSMFTRTSKQQGELTDLLINPKSRKILRFNEPYEPNQQLYDLYEDMKKAEDESQE